MEIRQYKTEKFLDSLSPAQILMLKLVIEGCSQESFEATIKLIHDKLAIFNEEYLLSDEVQKELKSFTVLVKKT